ncbi:butyrophilin-like protein 8 [Labeo rohita]|uniref:butyrophilin-like protein 8 n=1 Tax=Labeo rohita TaxID=84645 RepID=UPI0021E2D0A7|nr:butyrophilin-like protein 8 [Labeo rohita]
MLSIIVALLLNLLIETSVSFTVVVPGDPVVAHVGSTVILPCWINPPENAEALEIRWYRKNQFNNPVLHYKDGKIQDIHECFRNQTALTPRSDQSGGLKDGDVSLRLEKLTFQDEGSFHCEVSGENSYDSKVIDLKITERSSVSDQSDSSGPWKALFLTFLICALLGLVGLILYKYRNKLTGKKPAKEICGKEIMEKLKKEVVGYVNIEELRKHAVEITIDRERLHPDLTVSENRKIMRGGPEYKHTGEGFPYELCAFGAQRFTSGRHYWEVELAQKNTPPKNYWLIGVVKEGTFTSRDRSALTPSSGYWFLCSDGPNGFHTNTDQSVTFSLTPRPERLGVLLDYDEGQLSFYNIKESKHLLTISTTFSGSVVPLFNPGVGDESMLRILDCPKPVESAEESSQPLLSNNSSDG